MAQAKKFIPDGYHTLTPHFTIRGAAKAIEFYREAFGAEEILRMPGPDGRLMHAEIRIGDSILMLADEITEMGMKSPQTLNGTPAGLCVYVSDVDAAFARAVKAGATVKMPLADMFWGDRYGKVADPFGHEWSLAQHKEDLTPDEMAERSRKFFAENK